MSCKQRADGCYKWEDDNPNCEDQGKTCITSATGDGYCGIPSCSSNVDCDSANLAWAIVKKVIMEI